MPFTHNRNALFLVKGQMIDRIARFLRPRALQARVPYARKFKAHRGGNTPFDTVATILVKTVGTIRAFPPPPIKMLIFHGLQNQDPFIDRWHVSTLSGGKGGAKKAAKEEQTLLI